MPKYQEIAADFAAKLAEGKYQVGDRVYARSSLASMYNVSSETARRAVSLLADLGVLEVSRGSGVVILSIDKAVEFLRHFQAADSIDAIREELAQSISRQQQELAHFAEQVEDLAARAEKYRGCNPFIPYRVSIPGDCPLLGRTLQDVNFWHHTGATVIAIGREDKLLLSPGPLAELQTGCVLYYIGPTDCVARVQSFLTPATDRDLPLDDIEEAD